MAYTEKYKRDNARKTNSKLNPDGYIYIVKLKGFDIYKIGVSNNPNRRLRDINSYMPFEVELLMIEWFKNAYNLEECIHDNLKDKLLRHEWFRLTENQISDIIIALKNMSAVGNFLIRK